MNKRLWMLIKVMFATFVFGVSWGTLNFPVNASVVSQQDRIQLNRGRSSRERATRSQILLANEVRHKLVMLPWYNVFDWLEGEVTPEGAVTLRGQVVRPVTKSDAEASVKHIEGVTRVNNEIDVLPLSPFDDRLRVRVYRSLFNFNSPLFRYAEGSVPPIHIIVKNGNVTLKGIVATSMDSQLAYMAANGVPGAFRVTNELRVEQSERKRG